MRVALFLLAVVLVSCGCESSSSAQRVDASRPPSALPCTPETGCPGGDDGSELPSPESSVRCARDLASVGLPPVVHEASFFAGGDVTTACSAGPVRGSATYRYGQTGQPGAVCWVDLPAGAYWRFILVQDRSFTIATYANPASPLHGREWLVSCSGT